jgi:hypothetical protein
VYIVLLSQKEFQGVIAQNVVQFFRLARVKIFKTGCIPFYHISTYSWVAQRIEGERFDIDDIKSELSPGKSDPKSI